METQNYILLNRYSLSSLDADFKGNARISAIINYFIQAAWQHAEDLGWGLDVFGKLGYGWVLSRLKIKIDSLPKWPGEISIETWPKGVKRLFYMRDAKILDTSENTVASITSSWLIIDKTSKRPKLYEPNLEILSKNKNKNAINEEIDILKPEGNPIHSINYKVKYSDIDINQHLTTVKYIDYIFDSYNLDFITSNTPKEITVNFLKEATFGTELFMTRYEKENTHFFELINSENNVVCFRAELLY